MSIKFNPDWWKSLFDEVYLLTDARSVCNETLTRREVDLICELLPMRPHHKILDFCGGHGRHSLELCARGFTQCTLLDYSKTLLDVAMAEANRLNYTMNVVQSDARETELPSECFNHVLIMGNSLGYIQESNADRRILAEAYRLICPGGWFLVDVTDGAVVKRSITPVAWHEIGDDIVVCRNRDLQGEVVYAREMVLSKQKGLIRDETYAIRLYESNALAELMEQTGFRDIKIYTQFSPHPTKGDYGFMNQRMILLGRKI